MNEIRRPTRDDDEIAAVRAVVDRVALPEFVTGYEVRLGEFEGDPAMWIVFKLTGSDDLPEAEMTQRAKRMLALHRELDKLLPFEGDNRFLFFRSQYAGYTPPG